MRRASQFAQRYPYALKCDVQKYFPSIDHATLMSLVGRVVGGERLLSLIATVLNTHHDSVRQEWPTGGDL
jgi:RNA-directed DNA polymerase